MTRRRTALAQNGIAGFAGTATGFQPAPEAGREGDGRRRRRLQNREAVVDALLDLYREGNLRPSADEVAERARLSPRSVFRYFEDVDDLAGAAVARAQLRAMPLLELAADTRAARAPRIRALVDQRFRVFDEVGQAAAVVRLRAPFQPVLAALLAQNRAFLRDQVKGLFAAELHRLSRSRAREVLAALDVLSSYECYDLLLHDHGLSRAQARSAMAGSLEAVLRGAGSRHHGNGARAG